MTSESPIPPPIPKLQPADLVLALNEQGFGLTFLGQAEGGEVGAAYVQWPDGRDGVLTFSRAPLSDLLRTADLLQLARDRGLPCPQYTLIEPVLGGTAIVQQRLPGRPPAHVDRDLVRRITEVNRGFAGLLTGRIDIPPVPLYLDHSGPGFCLHESLAAFDPRSRRLLERIRAVGSEMTTMTGDDLVHLDLHPGNVLVDDNDAITGIVDWDGIGRGNHRFGLVTLLFDLGRRLAFDTDPGLDPATFTDLRTEVELIEPVALCAFWSHLALRQVDWSIRHHPESMVDHYLTFASDGLDRYSD